MGKKALFYLLGAVVAILLLAGTFSVGVFVGGVFAANDQPSDIDLSRVLAEITTPDSSITANPLSEGDLDSLFAPFWQAWTLVHELYVEQPVDDQEMMRGAIRGMLDSLGDQHSSYMDPDEFRQASIPLEGEYEGIGAWVDPDAEYLTIVSPMPDSPAERASLKPGDKIIAIDGEDMTGIDGNLVIQKVMGPAGTRVTLTILREGVDEPFDVTLIREKIIVPSVVSEMLDGEVAYIQLISFGEDTTAELQQALNDLLDQEPVGLVLDLRNNGGGALNTAIEVASQFIGEGVIMYEEYGSGRRDMYEALPDGLATEIPLIVLVNEGSASASEIVAGAIQDTNRGVLVGTRTFGKGSVQNWIPLKDDQGAIRVTIARWLTPNGRTIHEVGLEPDVVVELTEEDIQAERDPQLEKAIELLTE
jgi:carboxyl-terminal processing protease